MKRGRKILLLLTLLLVLSSSNVYAKKYQDTRGHWAEKYIDSMSDAGFIVGYESDMFKPDNYISRVEFYAVVNSMANLEKTYAVTFSDVTISDWYYKEVAKAIKAGYLIPTTGKLNPDRPITRQEVMGILGYMYKLKPDVSATTKFKDAQAFSAENRGYAGVLIGVGVVDGGPDLLLRPNAGISRGEICKILDMLMDEYGLPDKRVVVDSKIKFGDRNLYN
ncbi:S-layer homology domain-containing protein [Peptoniphilus sp. oral taxon 386]|uniref:S-layer homology domain-containing protein n=1 Tax=Peptoniphilus sp. oral taxon 386 TaxID=652713 RepID=UPI0001DA9A22|nr:S-layer homology domain-containing protein [Peptoniphilus sp. oral taxon 386]EFI41852.1 hypothetical protein HMPREF0629_00481 [Peptoniphilus sp. oral taxon 386 str. F0131]